MRAVKGGGGQDVSKGAQCMGERVVDVPFMMKKPLPWYQPAFAQA